MNLIEQVRRLKLPTYVAIDDFHRDAPPSIQGTFGTVLGASKSLEALANRFKETSWFDTPKDGKRLWIIWLCPPDPDAIVRIMLHRLVRHHGSGSRYRIIGELRKVATSDLEENAKDCIDAYDLWYAWVTFIDRLTVAGRTSEESIAVHSAAWDRFEVAIKKMSHGPKKLDWEELDELLMK